MLSFFGMGLLGSNFVRALRKRGEEVHVWNRTHEKAVALESEGAKAFEDPADAARGATRIHLTLSDDQAVDDVLERAQAGIARGAVIVDHSTTSAPGVLERRERWHERGVTFVHAPVFMGPQNARESTGLMLVSGPRAELEPLREPLAAMTGKLVDLGERPDAAAAFKLMGNLFLMNLTVGLAEMLTLAKALDVAPQEAATIFDHFNPGTSIGWRIKKMVDGQFDDPSWELQMARKDARLMLEAANEAEVALATLPAIIDRMDDLIAEGHGGDDWTVIAKDAVS
ncbi:MAG TPA: NAD(P)-dependent oxidoreductase [Kofleriaceae bacterium]|nr:NAD(P)-dependent oxidoreductase [Kofleriaceae bacterium]